MKQCWIQNMEKKIRKISLLILRFFFVSLQFFRFILLISRSFLLQTFAISLRCKTSEIMHFFCFQAKRNFRFNFNFRFRSENESAPYLGTTLPSWFMFFFCLQVEISQQIHPIYFVNMLSKLLLSCYLVHHSYIQLIRTDRASVLRESSQFLERRQNLPNRTNQPIGKRHKRLRLACYFIKLNMDKIAACRYANREPNKQEVGFIFAWSGSELWTLIKYSRSKIKNLKYIAVDVPFKGLSNDTTLMQIQSGRTVPLRFI